MKNRPLLYILLAFLLVACGKPAPAPTITSAAITATLTLPAATATRAPTATATLPPTKTAKPSSTSTNTPHPTNTAISLADWPTRTPQAPAACPSINAKLRISLAAVFKDKKAAYHDARQAVLDFLNAGGDPQTAIQKLAGIGVTASQMDVTNDGVPEFSLPSGYLTVFGCSQGQYQTLLDIAPTEHTEMSAIPLVIQDLNHNGLPEVLFGQALSGDHAMYRIFEWDGTKLANLAPKKFQGENTHIYIEEQVIHTFGQSNAQKGALVGNFEIADTDGNGLKEIVIRAGVYQGYFSSDLEDQMVLKWDGQSYVVGAVTKESTPTPEPTFTPLPFSATCSYQVPGLKYQPPTSGSLTQAISDYLNAGGQPEQIKSYYQVTVQDFNKDTAPEILVVTSPMFPAIYLFSCQEGKYKDTGVFENDGASNSITILAVRDNNKNGFVEVFVKNIGCFWNRCGALYVVEWNGEKFAQILQDIAWDKEIVSYATMSEPADAFLSDLDNDSIKELVWTGEVTPSWHGDHWSFYPQRLATHVFKWDGKNYAAQPVEYAAPEYRFQAVQDGDLYAKAGWYEKALKSYKSAIQNESLGWWTQERKFYIIGPHGLGPCAEKPSNCPPPTPDPNERPTLGAYAAFRILLVHLLTGNQAEAEKAYLDLLATYPQGNPAYPLTAMATAFWSEYQTAPSLSNACEKALSAIVREKDILRILTGEANVQGLNYLYQPEEVCPFK